MNAKYLEVSGRTYYAFEEPEFVGPQLVVRPEPGTLSTVEKYNEGDIESGFWKRQFGSIVTRRQRKWDWAFGVFMPAICFFFDPIVFRDWSGNSGLLSGYKIFVYLLSGTAIMGLAAWLLWGDRLKALNAPLAGLFFAAGAAAGVVGILLIPISVLASVILIGWLGFTPLFTSVVFLRNAIRASRSASADLDNTLIRYIVPISALAALVIPWVMNASFPQTVSRGPLFP
ncbi:MAG: hypothetical protein ABL999_20065 [Pyrinomonadaceae bacterium]